MMDELLGLCEDLVRKAISSGADEAEAYWNTGTQLDVELEEGRIAFASSSRDQGGALRIVKDGRLGFAYLTDATTGKAAAERALKNARLAPAKGYTLPTPGALPQMGRRFDADVAALDPETALGLATELLAGAEEGHPQAVVAGGGVGLAWEAEALASSAGVACADHASQVQASAALVLGESGAAVSHHDHVVAHALTIDARALGRETARTTATLAGPGDPGPSGRRDVVFRADAVAELLADLLASAVLGDDAMRGKTVWSGRLGEAVADGVTLADDPLHPAAVGQAPFDAEGLPSKRVEFVQDGVLRTYLFDSWSAHEHRQPCTNSAQRSGFKSRPETGLHHLVIEGPPTLSADRLVGGIDEGYVVGSVLGAHTANATTGEFSITAPNVWRIQGGEVVGAVKEVALTGRLDGLLASLDAMGDRLKPLGQAALPDLRFRGLDVAA